MTDDLLARAKTALEGVTPGPWEVCREEWAVISSGSDSVLHGYAETTCDDCGSEVNERAQVAISIEDAEFIAAARSLVPELVAEVEQLRALEQRITELAQSWSHARTFGGGADIIRRSYGDELENEIRGDS